MTQWQILTVFSMNKNMYKKIEILLIFFILLFTGFCYSQSNIHIKSNIVNSETLEPLIYASIFNKTNNSGTTSDLNGNFTLNNIRNGDTIVISYIGFQTKKITVTSGNIDTIALNPSKNLLNEVVITADNSFLYNLIYKCHNSVTKKIKKAKTYLSVESFRDGKKIELIENYYNASFKGYDIDEFKLKNGRIAYKKYKNRSFNSTQTSFAIFYNKLFDKNSLYPSNPLSLSKRKLKKYYKLSVDSKYKNTKDEIIYVIIFEPKIKKQKYFQGKLWINRNTNQLLKINLNINNSEISPFIPLHKGLADIDLLELSISKSFTKIEGEMFVKSIDFKYTIKYYPKQPIYSSPYLISTTAFLYAYNYNDKFILPKFHFSNTMYQDYLQVSAFPYNSKFWNNIKEFTISNFQEKSDSFVSDNIMYYDKKFSQRGRFGGDSSIGNNTGFFIAPYIFWSKNRISFREDFDIAKYQKLLPSDRYRFNVQIYMDVNTIKDTIDVLTKSIFDPNLSSYHFHQTKESSAFINMYFDLIEIKRRELDNRIKLIKKRTINNNIKIEQIEKLYQAIQMEIQEISKDYFKDTQRGANKKGMIHWNSYVKNNLGIDNIFIFNLFN